MKSKEEIELLERREEKLMRRADNKELEEAIGILKEIQETNRAWLKETKEENCEKIYLKDIEAIETVLKELKRLQEENSKLNLF